MSELTDALEEFAGELALEGYEGKFNLVHQAAERIRELEAICIPRESEPG
jgi:hypothetical protein